MSVAFYVLLVVALCLSCVVSLVGSAGPPKVTWVETVAGSPIGTSTMGFLDANGTNARFTYTLGVAVDSTNGVLYISDFSNCAIRAMLTNFTVITIAGSPPTTGRSCSFLDALMGTNARFGTVWSLAIQANVLYVSDYSNHRVRAVDISSSGSFAVTTVAGQSSPGHDDGIGTLAQFTNPTNLAYHAASDSLFVLDYDDNLRRIALSTRSVTTIAGVGGSPGFADGIGTVARFHSPDGVTFHPNSDLAIVADNSNHALRLVNVSSWLVTTLAGSFPPTTSSGYVDGNGTSARLSNPHSVTYDRNTNGLVWVEFGNHAVRWASLTGNVITLAGSRPPTNVSGHVDGDATTARFDRPFSIAVHPTRDGLYIVSDTYSSSIRFVYLASNRNLSPSVSPTTHLSGSSSSSWRPSLSSTQSPRQSVSESATISSSQPTQSADVSASSSAASVTGSPSEGMSLSWSQPTLSAGFSLTSSSSVAATPTQSNTKVATLTHSHASASPTSAVTQLRTKSVSRSPTITNRESRTKSATETHKLNQTPCNELHDTSSSSHTIVAPLTHSYRSDLRSATLSTTPSNQSSSTSVNVSPSSAISESLNEESLTETHWLNESHSSILNETNTASLSSTMTSNALTNSASSSSSHSSSAPCSGVRAVERIRDVLRSAGLADGWQPTSVSSYWSIANGNATARGNMTTDDAIDFTCAKSATTDVPILSTFTLELGGGQFVAPSVFWSGPAGLIVSETKGRLSVSVTATSTTALRVVVSYTGAATVSIYVGESVTAMFPVAALVCPTKLNVSAWQGDAAALKGGFIPMTFSLKPAQLLISASAMKTTNQLTSGLSVVSASPASGVVVARIAMLSAFVDCAVDKVEDDGNSLTGYHFGDSRGQYQRGAVAANLFLLYGGCGCVLLVIALPIGIASAVCGGDVVTSVTRALDVAHVPSVFVVPFAVVYQPTLTSALRLMIWRPVPGDALLGFIGVALLAAFAVPFVWVLAYRFPCDAVPRQSADLEKIRRKASKSSVLRRAERLCGPATLELVIRLFNARVHWKVRSPSMQRWKRRFLMLFDDWACIWYPILDIVASASLAVLASVISGDATSCKVVVGLTSAVYLVLFAGAVLRPCMNWLNNGYLVLVNALSFASSISLLYNQLSPNNDAVQFSVLCLFGVTALTSVKMFPDLIVKVVALRYAILPGLLASIRARPAVQPQPLPPPSLPVVEPIAPASESVEEPQPMGGDVAIVIHRDPAAEVETIANGDESASTGLVVNEVVASNNDVMLPTEEDADEIQRAFEDEIAAAFFATVASASTATSDPAVCPTLLLLDDSAPTAKRNDLMDAYDTAQAGCEASRIEDEHEFDLDDLLGAER